ncbi:hypothetical protein CR513_29748, partial [Mucuna pruriens]
MQPSLRISLGTIYTTKARQDSTPRSTMKTTEVRLHITRVAWVRGTDSITQSRCLKCGYPSYLGGECVDGEMTCFNCGKQGHIMRSCTFPKRGLPSARSVESSCLKTTGRVFVCSNVEASKFENLVQGTCFVNCNPLVVLFDCIATYSFISHDYVSKLKFPMSSLNYKLVVETPSNDSIVTLNVYLQCPLNLSTNHILVNCTNQTIVFRTPIVDKDKRFITANQAKVEKSVVVGDVLVDVSSLSPEMETEFFIDEI